MKRDIIDLENHKITFVNIGTHYTNKGPNLLLIWQDGTQKEFDPQGHLVK